MVQGTLNGLGERCGNANLISIIPSLMLKMGFATGIDAAGLERLTHVSRFLDERLNRASNRHAAYVGERLAHKGGLHVSAMARIDTTYEHIAPAHVGNRRRSSSPGPGRASKPARRGSSEIGIAVAAEYLRIPALLEIVKRREFEGYTYDRRGGELRVAGPPNAW